jgi:alkaline phosphatase D
LSRVLFISVCCLVCFLSPAVAEAQQGSTYITHGPILGRLGAHEIGIWARTHRSGEFRVRYGLRQGHLDMLSEPVTTEVDHDNTGWAHITGLEADAEYYYQLVVGENEMPATLREGSFHTLPDPDEVRDPVYNPEGLFNFSFEFACGNSQSPSGLGPTLPTFKTMLERLPGKIDFAILNGDWLYEYDRDYPADQWLSAVGLSEGEAPHVVDVAPTITGVWQNYKSYLERGNNLSLWHRVVPSFFTLDDHEILDNVFGSGTAGFRHRRAVFRDMGVQGWYDYLAWSNPTHTEQGIVFGKAALEAGNDVLTDPGADFTQLDLDQAATLLVHWGTPTAGVSQGALDRGEGDPNAAVYDIVEVLDAHRLRIYPAAKEDGTPSYSIGRQSYSKMRVSNSEFFFLDTRSHRTVYDVTQPDKPGVSMLGVRQKEWLMDVMRDSDAEFFFVLSSVNLTVPHVGGTGSTTSGAPTRDDAWTGFLEEREELIHFWDSLGQPVFVLTGDLHNSFAVQITDGVWEFASGPHNSRNHAAAAEAGRPPNGPFESQGRTVDIRWSTYMLNETPVALRTQPIFTVVQVNNVLTNRQEEGPDRLVAYPIPQVVFQYYDGFTGDLLYAESILGTPRTSGGPEAPGPGTPDEGTR